MGIFGIEQDVAIIGALFLKSVYTVLSYSHDGVPAVGFAVSSTAGVSSAPLISSGSASAQANSSSPAFIPTAVAVVSSVTIESAEIYTPDPTPAVKMAVGSASAEVGG